MDAPQPGDRARCRRSAPLFVHAVSGINSQLEKFRSFVQQTGKALPRRQSALVVLRFDGFGAAAFANLLFFVAYHCHQLRHGAHVFFEAGGSHIGARFQLVQSGAATWMRSVGHERDTQQREANSLR